MQQFYNALKASYLFRGFSDEELEAILACLDANIKTYKKNQIIRESDTKIKEVGIIVEGSVYITKTDYDGNRTILNEVKISESFGESLAFFENDNSPIILVAAEKTSVVFLCAKRIIEGCESSCRFHSSMTKNLLILMAHKIVTLQMKNDILSRKTTREKLLLYFEYESRTAKSKIFRIHFSRTELADFLCLNTSAMSRELGKMRDEGILSFHKNQFVLKNVATNRNNSLK